MRDDRRAFLDALGKLNQMTLDEFGDPEIATRIAQYEMAFRMQTLGARADRSFEGAGAAPSSFTARTRRSRAPSPPIACWRAGWPSAACASSSSSIATGTITASCPQDLPKRCKDTDQASAALITDLKAARHAGRHAGHLGRRIRTHRLLPGPPDADDYGRDHHPRCFTIWMAGGGIKPGITLGETDDYCYNITKDPVHVHDLQATILHCLGIDHTKLTYKFQGRHFRLDGCGRQRGEADSGVGQRSVRPSPTAQLDGVVPPPP